MDLFVINRYKETDEEVNQQDLEAEHLRKLKRKIEERKKNNLLQKQLQVNEITLVEPTATVTERVSPHSDYLLKVESTDTDTVSSKENTQRVKLGKQSGSEFKVLGTNEFEKKTKVKRVLPHWLSNPVTISTNLKDLQCSIDHENWLHPILQTTLQNEGVTQLFPVQEKVIPFVLSQHKLPAPLWPCDVCVSAPTGSGKTLSFALPIIQVLMNESGRHVRALIVLPVQELAAQVAKVFRKYCTNTGLRVALLSGSTPLRQEQHQLVYYTESSSWLSQVDIVVCTAGRLVEHILNTEGFCLKHLKFLVIDEADRIMDRIQNDWLYHLDRHIKLESQLLSGKVPTLYWNNLIMQKCPPHKLLFSATLSQDPEKLDQWGLFQPKLFSAAPKSNFEDDEQIRKYTTPSELTEKCIITGPEEKPLILYHLLREKKWNRVLCFTNASQSAHRLSLLLKYLGNDEIKVAELSAALNRTTRDSVLKKFQQSEINVLIGTDTLARGIDIPDCDYVVSYDAPRDIKTYIHRVGRTGRAGRQGCAVTMLLPNQLQLFKDVLQAAGKSELPQLDIPSEMIEKLNEKYVSAIHETKKYINEEVNSKVTKSKALKRGFNSKNKKKKVPNMLQKKK